MHNSNSPVRRRSSRVPAKVPILVTSKDPAARFSEICQTLVVSAHGCLFRSPIKLDAGAVVHFHTEEGRENTAQVVFCQPIDADQRAWRLGAKLDRPENFWGLEAYPQDWAVLTGPSIAEKKALVKSLPKNVHVIEQPQIPPVVKSALEEIQRQISDDRLGSLMREMLEPLKVEVASLRERLAQGPPRRSSFEVSLSQIPPELEKQIEARLRNELSPRMLEQARQQSAQVLDSVRETIAQKTREGHEQFVQRINQQVQTAEKRVQALSDEIAGSLREQIRSGAGEFQHKVMDAAGRLKRLTEELLAFLQSSLTEEHEARRQDLQQLQASITAEASRLHTETTDLDGRIERLDGSVRRLESGLDKRLGQMASDTVTSVRTRLEQEIDGLMKVLESRGTQELGARMDEASTRLNNIGKEMEAAVSASLQSQVNQTIASFERSMDDLAKQSYEQWRSTVSRSLNSVLKSLGEELGSE